MEENIDKNIMKKYFRRNNLSLNKLLNTIFNKKILRVTYLGNNKLMKMPEYGFSLLKFNVVLEDYSNYNIFIKLISKCRIKESLFCYWFFCEENYSFNTKFYAPKANIVNYKTKSYEKKFELQFLSKNNKVWKSSFVDIINLNQYKMAYISSIKRKQLDILNKFLFVAII